MAQSIGSHQIINQKIRRICCKISANKVNKRFSATRIGFALAEKQSLKDTPSLMVVSFVFCRDLIALLLIYMMMLRGLGTISCKVTLQCLYKNDVDGDEDISLKTQIQILNDIEHVIAIFVVSAILKRTDGTRQKADSRKLTRKTPSADANPTVVVV